jgi:hypothetical protein
VHAVLDLPAPCENQDRNRGFSPAQVFQDAHTVEPGQVQIQDHQVVIELGRQRARLLAIGGHVNRIVFRLQTFAHKSSQGRIVFYQQNTHDADSPECS